MNKLVAGMEKESNKTLTDNGMKIKKSSENALVDLFYAIGSSRGQEDRVVELFQKAFKADADVAVRIALYGRDVRGGMGERGVFRAIMTDLASRDFKTAKKVIAKIPEVGRWDDVLALVGTPVEKEALDLYASALEDGNGLAAKWAPREKSTKKVLAAKLRDHIFGKASTTEAKNRNSKAYRKMLTAGTDVVEQRMSAGQWKKIEFSHVPSLASSRYQKAFERHAPTQYNSFLAKLETGDTTINAGAVYPYDVTKSLRWGNSRAAEQQWKALPDFIGSDKTFMPIVDVSGSMGVQVASNVSAMDVAVGLGIYCAQRNRSEFKDKFLTFTSEPSFMDIGGLSLESAVNKTYRAPWGMTTDLELAMKTIVDTAVKHNVPAEDIPNVLLIISDMQFNSAVRGPNKPNKMIRDKFESAGYKMPQIVYWNVNASGNSTPVKFDKEGTALVSGFSPAIMKSVLSSDLERFTPLNIVLDAVMQSRYDWQ